MTQAIESPAAKSVDRQCILYIQADNDLEGGSWHFELFDTSGEMLLEARGDEADTSIERLALLGTVRALESLDGPTRVTLAGCSRYIRHGLRFGLPSWREQGWRWECFGRLVPIRNGDLWKRLDRALHYHRIVAIGGSDKGFRFSNCMPRSLDDPGELKPDDGEKMRKSGKPRPITLRRSGARSRRGPIRSQETGRPKRAPSTANKRRRSTEKSSDAPPRQAKSPGQPRSRVQGAVRGVRRMVGLIGDMAKTLIESKRARTLLGFDR